MKRDENYCWILYAPNGDVIDHDYDYTRSEDVVRIVQYSFPKKNLKILYKNGDVAQSGRGNRFKPD